jgi:hypothetical protein
VLFTQFDPYTHLKDTEKKLHKNHISNTEKSLILPLLRQNAVIYLYEAVFHYWYNTIIYSAAYIPARITSSEEILLGYRIALTLLYILANIYATQQGDIFPILLLICSCLIKRINALNIFV